MTLSNDRFVTPTFVIPMLTKGAIIVAPTLDDAANINIEVASQGDSHRFNYPAVPGGYAANGVILEFDMDDADGTTITDNANNVVLTEQGDPAFQQSAAVAGLGKGVAFDGTGDAFDALAASLPADIFPTTGDFAIEIVQKGTNASAGAGDTLFALRSGAAGVGIQLQLDANQHLDAHIKDADQEVAMTTTTDVATGSIQHIVVDYDRSANCTAYVNGAAVSTAAAITSAEKTCWPGTGANNRLCIGGDAARTAGDCFYGTIYFVRMYNRILGATEAKANYDTLVGRVLPPAFLPLMDFFDGDDLVFIKSGSTPCVVALQNDLLDALRGVPIRLACDVEQTTTPLELEFGLIYS